MPDLQRAHRVAVGPHRQVVRPCAHDVAAVDVVARDLLRLEADEAVGVQQVGATAGGEQAAMSRRFGDQAVEKLEAERQCVADQRDIGVRLVDRSSARQRVAERVDRHLPHRTADEHDGRHGRQQRRRESTGARRDCAVAAFARRGSLHTLSAGLPLTPTLESVARKPLIQRNLAPPRAENACGAAPRRHADPTNVRLPRESPGPRARPRSHRSPARPRRRRDCRRRPACRPSRRAICSPCCGC